MSLVDRVVDYVTEEENEKLEVRQRKGRRAGGRRKTYWRNAECRKCARLSNAFESAY